MEFFVIKNKTEILVKHKEKFHHVHKAERTNPTTNDVVIFYWVGDSITFVPSLLVSFEPNSIMEADVKKWLSQIDHLGQDFEYWDKWLVQLGQLVPYHFQYTPKQDQEFDVWFERIKHFRGNPDWRL